MEGAENVPSAYWNFGNDHPHVGRLVLGSGKHYFAESA